MLLQARMDGDKDTQAVNPPQGSPRVLESEETYSSATLAHGQQMHLGEHKVLGVRWNICSDRIIVDLCENATIARALDPTKRNIVSLVGRFYDPLGTCHQLLYDSRCSFKS